MQELIISSLPLLAAILIATIRYKKLEPPILRLFAWFMITSFLIQIAGYFYSLLLHNKSNHFIFNSYTFIEYGIYLSTLFQVVTYKKLKTAVLCAGVSFVLVYAYEIFIAGSYFVYSAFACNIGNFLTLVCCMLYLSELLMTDKIINFFKIRLFWIVTGLMFASIGNFFYLCFFDYIVKNNIDANGEIYGLISTVTTVVEYVFFSVGFLIKADD